MWKRHANARTVVGKGGEAIVVNCNIDVAVVVVVERKVPVATVETDTVSEDLKGGRWAAVWLAVGRSNMVLLRDRGITLEDIVGVVDALLQLI